MEMAKITHHKLMKRIATAEEEIDHLNRYITDLKAQFGTYEHEISDLNVLIGDLERRKVIVAPPTRIPVHADPRNFPEWTPTKASMPPPMHDLSKSYDHGRQDRSPISAAPLRPSRGYEVRQNTSALRTDISKSPNRLDARDVSPTLHNKMGLGPHPQGSKP
jgi:hypothetical protein